MNKLWYINNHGILVSNIKGQIIDTHNSLDESLENYASEKANSKVTYFMISLIYHF